MYRLKFLFMKELVLTQFNRLPEHLQEEVLRFIQLLLRQTGKSSTSSPNKPKRPAKLTFSDFRFPDNGNTYSRSEIYGDNGR